MHDIKHAREDEGVLHLLNRQQPDGGLEKRESPYLPVIDWSLR